MNKITLIISIFILFSSHLILAQDFEIKNVTFSRLEKEVIIFYDLIDEEGDKYNINIKLVRESDSSYIYYPKLVSGEVGENIESGIRKKIIWEIDKEIENKIIGDDFYFSIEATLIESNLFYYIGGGSIIVGGVVACLIFCSKEDSEPVIADPPDRP